MKNLLYVLLVALIIISCKNADVAEKELETDPIAELYLMMQGSYSSLNQAAEDSTYHHMVMNVCPIWEGKGNYLYAEVAHNDSINRPIKQRIFKLSRVNDSVYVNSIFSLKDEAFWSNKWAMPKEFSKLKQEDLTEVSGCHITLKRIRPTYYQGKTEEMGCYDNLNGAMVSISELEVFDDKIITWDKGYNENGEQVWGSIHGGYIFDRVN
ncbi:chromophore lyase CpcT/CpeT [Aegicerativicinus sediminis]